MKIITLGPDVLAQLATAHSGGKAAIAIFPFTIDAGHAFHRVLIPSQNDPETIARALCQKIKEVLLEKPEIKVSVKFHGFCCSSHPAIWFNVFTIFFEGTPEVHNFITKEALESLNLEPQEA